MKKTLISTLQLEQLKAILAGHMHHFFEERFSPPPSNIRWALPLTVMCK